MPRRARGDRDGKRGVVVIDDGARPCDRERPDGDQERLLRAFAVEEALAGPVDGLSRGEEVA